MRKGVIILVLIICMSSFISAEVIFTEQLKSVYNLGDAIHVPVTVKATSTINGLFQMDLVCNGTAVNFYKNGVNLAAGEEKNFDSYLVLIKSIIGDMRGMCQIKAMIAGGYVLSNEFKISDSLIIIGDLEKKDFNPGENILLSGKVTKETGENSEGSMEASLLSDNESENIIQRSVVSSGSFSMSISIPSDLRAGNYILRLKAFEKDSEGVTTNTGFKDYNISIKQIPTNLEVIIDNQLVTPGTSVKIKAILHDQTGEPIISVAFISIKNQNDKILEQKEVITGDFFEYPISANQPPAEWKVFAISHQLTAENEFQIKINEKIDIQITNKTILITNTGNVPYNKTVLVDVGGTTLTVFVNLEVGKSKKYIVSAPDGEYKVDVKTGEGEEVSNVMSLTGRAVSVNEVGSGHYTVLAWILMFLILGFIIFTIFRKIYKKPFSVKRVFKKNIKGKR